MKPGLAIAKTMGNPYCGQKPPVGNCYTIAKYEALALFNGMLDDVPCFPYV